MPDEFDLNLKVLQWRELVRNGRGAEISRDDMRKAVQALRGERTVAQTVRETAAKKPKKPAPKDASGLLADFAAQSGGQPSIKLEEDDDAAVRKD